MSQISLLNKIYILEVILFGLIITGLLPREVSIFLALGLVIYFVIAPIEDATVFFIRSIPLFIAIPITANYDNLNTWRILSAIIFIKWAWPQIKNLKLKIKNYNLKVKNLINDPIFLLSLMFVFTFLSVIPAINKIAALTRIIYFVNLSLIGIVIYDLTTENKNFAERLIKNIAIPTIIVTVVGFVQIASTYFIDIYQFMRIWGEGIQCRQFGEEWCNIAVQLGNTWFAYYGEQLSLRVFSLFPDSHSFPQFVLLGIPAVLVVIYKKWVRIVSLSLLFLIIILSGTRGIWAASVGVILLYFVLMLHMRKWELINLAYAKFISFKKLGWYLGIFFVMFAIAFPIFSSPQFLIGKGDDLLKARIKSILDFGETSNAQRIEIWKASFESIKEHPLLGVGIGNFPVILDQKIFLARAGSSAHNIYLHIASEMGILALITAIWFLWLVFKKSYKNFVSEQDPLLVTYFGATILFVPWVLIYSLTDVALFDERSFLLFVATISLIFGTKNSTTAA